MIILRPNTPWFNQELEEAICKRRKSERAWRKSGLAIDYQICKHQCTEVSSTLRQAIYDFCSTKIADAGSDQKALFTIVKSLMNSKSDLPLPKHDSHETLAGDFGRFFVDKIAKIRSSLDSLSPSVIDEDTVHLNATHSLDHFTEASVTEVVKFITGSPSKSCCLDPIPT